MSATEQLPGTPPTEDEPEGFAARYDMSVEEARQLCHNFLISPEVQAPDGQYGCYKISGQNPFSNLGRFVESDVFDETFNNTAELMQEEYSPYDKSSDFYVVIDQEAKLPVGVMRLIKNSEAGFKSLNDLPKVNAGFTKDDVFQGYALDPEKCVDIATLAVLSDYRGSKTAYLPSLLMYRTLYQDILSNPQYDQVLTIIDKKAEKNLYTLKFPFKPIFDSDYFSYLDSSESRALIAKGSMFRPQLTYWTAKMREEIGGKEGTTEELIANTMEALVNPGYLDSMLATDQSRAKEKN